MKLSALKNDINMINMRMNSLGTFGKPRGFGSGGFTAVTPDWKPPKKKKKKNNTEKLDKKKSGKKNKAGGNGYDKSGTPSFEDERQSASGQMLGGQGAVSQGVAEQGVANRYGAAYGSAPAPINLQEAVVWAEILGEPVSKRRRRRRVSWQDGNQGNADRR